MFEELRQVITEFLAGIPGFPAYAAVIVPGFCAWLIILTRERKENHNHQSGVKRPGVEATRGEQD